MCDISEKASSPTSAEGSRDQTLDLHHPFIHNQVTLPEKRIFLANIVCPLYLLPLPDQRNLLLTLPDK